MAPAKKSTTPARPKEYTDRLAAVNKQLKLTNIKGKDYAEVNQRLLGFWALFPNGRIEPIVTGDTGERIDMVCNVYRDMNDTIPCVTAHSYEIYGKGVNASSYVENCETSVVGRALGLLGIGATTSVASYDEVERAVAARDEGRARKAVPASETTTVVATKPVEFSKEHAEALQPVRDLWEDYLAATKLGPAEASRAIASYAGHEKISQVKHNEIEAVLEKMHEAIDRGRA
jgi:hypothetical protein